MDDHFDVYLFAYGTLCSFFTNPFAFRLKAEGSLITKGFVQGRLFDLGDYPAVIESSASDQSIVWGEIYRISRTSFSWIDSYEGMVSPGNPLNEYNRKQVDAIADKEVYKVWVYFYNHGTENFSEISGGDYISYLLD